MQHKLLYNYTLYNITYCILSYISVIYQTICNMLFNFEIWVCSNIYQYVINVIIYMIKYVQTYHLI